MIEVYLLEQLEAFARLGTLSAAAEELHLSQPALTRSMQKLEDLIGVPLFERQKNRLALNENGKLAAELAGRVLAEDREIAQRVREFDRKCHTISIGSCAPIPLEDVAGKAARLFEDRTIAQTLGRDDELLRGLQNGEHGLVILHEEPNEEGLYWKRWGEESLQIALPKTNPLAGKKGIRFRELEGQSILLYSQIGFWYDLCCEKIPNPRFLMQDDFNTFGELSIASALPVFTTEYFYREDDPNYADRVAVPILDEEAQVTYYLACNTRDKRRFRPLFDQIGI